MVLNSCWLDVALTEFGEKREWQMVAKKAKPFALYYFSWHNCCQAGVLHAGFLSYPPACEKSHTYNFSPPSACAVPFPRTPALLLQRSSQQTCHPWKNPTTRTT